MQYRNAVLFKPALFKSTDGGRQFVPLGGEGLPLEPLSELLFVPSGSSTLFYAATRGAGVFRSGDGGRTWHDTNRGLSNLLVDGCRPPTSRECRALRRHR